MNLTALFDKDQALKACLNDLSWMEDSGLARKDDPYLNIEGMKNPNNVKPQLELEWGVGGPNVDIDEPAGVVQRNLPADYEGDAGGAIVFARDLQNRGLRGSQVVKALKAKYSKDTLRKAAAGLREQFGWDGVVGRIAVDGRGYRSCQDALKAAANSPYKRFLKYVIGCCCGDPQCIPMQDGEMFSDIPTTGNGIDDFFTASVVSKQKLVSHCRTTMLPIFVASSDLDPSEMDATLIDMGNTVGVPEEVIAGVRKMNCSNLKKVRSAFRMIDLQKDRIEASQYKGAVDNSEFWIGQADNEVDLSGAPEPEIPLDVIEEPEMQEVMVPDSSLDTDLLAEEPETEVDIEFGGQDSFGMGDIDMEMAPEPEFVDTDIIILDEPKGPDAELDVNMRQDMEI